MIKAAQFIIYCLHVDRLVIASFSGLNHRVPDWKYFRLNFWNIHKFLHTQTAKTHHACLSMFDMLFTPIKHFQEVCYEHKECIKLLLWWFCIDCQVFNVYVCCVCVYRASNSCFMYSTRFAQNVHPPQPMKEYSFMQKPNSKCELNNQEKQENLHPAR